MLVEEEFMRELGVKPEEWAKIKRILATGKQFTKEDVEKLSKIPVVFVPVGFGLK
jgi:hypothetical protein